MTRSPWKITVLPEPRWAGWLLVIGVLIIDGVIAAMLFSTPQMTLAERVFWIVFAVAVPVAVVLAATYRFAGVATRAKDLANSHGQSSVSIGFARAAKYVATPGENSPIDVFSSGVLLAAGDAIQLLVGTEAGKPDLVRPLREVASVDGIRVFPGLGFAPLLSVTFTDDVVLEMVVVHGRWTDMFGPTWAQIRQLVDALRARVIPRDS
jgi:hypothetical protein